MRFELPLPEDLQTCAEWARKDCVSWTEVGVELW